MTSRNQPKTSNSNQEQQSSETFYDDDYVQNNLSIQRFNQECCFVNFFVCFIFTIGIYALLTYDLASKNVSIIDPIKVININFSNETLDSDVFTNVDNLTRIIFDK